jgi:pimeloyl-ACP methyl ester carboxylesterase
MKNISILIVVLAFSSCSRAQSITGYWTGTMEMNGKTIDISFDLDSNDKLFSSYDLMLLRQPISNLTIKNGIISFSVVRDVEVVFKGTISGKEITGTATMNGGPPNMNITFSATKQAEKPVKPYSIETLTIKSNAVSLSADIYKPHTKGLNPAIVLLHGSSSNLRRDYIFYAEYFAKLGFEVLIFDKRGSGKSTGNYYTSSYDDLIADVIVCLATMYNRESVDKNNIGLWGLSQGAMLLSKIATETNIPKFLIAISPDVSSVVEAAAFSDSLFVVNSGNSELNGHIVAESHRTVAKMIREQKSYNEVEAFIRQNAQLYSFMDQTGLSGHTDIDKDAFNGFYWQGRKEHFISYWKSINMPTLVVFGGRDNLVNSEKNISILKSINNPNIEIKLYPKANHNLKKSVNPNIDTEFDWPRIIEGYTECVEKWIKSEIEK